ncbi:unnamed protein product [Linum tenue]|nr:unnamed protein product [Linum tenue]
MISPFIFLVVDWATGRKRFWWLFLSLWMKQTLELARGRETSCCRQAFYSQSLGERGSQIRRVISVKMAKARTCTPFQIFWYKE